MLASPTSHLVRACEGTLEDPTRTYRKHLREVDGRDADQAAFDVLQATDGDRIVYQVQDRHPAQGGGDLIFGVTLKVSLRVLLEQRNCGSCF